MANLSNGLGVDDVYVGVNPPTAVLGGGGKQANYGLVGLGSWGPLNVPLSGNTPQQLFALFGPPANSGKDIVQEGALFLSQQPLGATVGVRVDNGDSVASTGALLDSAGGTGLHANGKYNGTFGNQVTVQIVAGTNSTVGAPTWKVIVKAGTNRPEFWDRIPTGATPAATWLNILNAVNSGQTAVNPASRYTILTGVGTANPPVAQTVTLTGGSNGSLPTTAAQIGQDGTTGSRTGMYALRSKGCRVVGLAGCTDSASWATMAAFAISENTIAAGNLPPNTSPTAAIAAKIGAGIDTPYMYLAVGTVTYLDSYFNTNVTLPQASVIAGVGCSITSEQPWGNRVVYGILGTEQTLGANPQPYSFADMSSMEAAGLIFITSPIPSANAFGTRHGKNTSSNFATSELAYTAKTNDLAVTFQSTVMGQFVNRLQSTRANDPLREQVEGAFRAYLGPQSLASPPVINAYDVQCDLGNNPVANIQAGLLRADVIVQYLSVVNQFVINLTAGQTVDVVVANTQSVAA